MNLIKKIFTKKIDIKKMKKVCVIIVNSSDSNIKRIKKRITTIQEEIKIIGIDKVIIYDQNSYIDNFNNLARIKSKQELMKIIDNTNVLLVTDSQFAISNEVVLHVLKIQNDDNKVVTLDDTENLITNSPLFGNFILLHSKFVNVILDSINQNCIFPDNILSNVKKVVLTNEIIAKIYAKQAKKILPTTITLEASNRCNQSCSFCPYHGKPQKNGWRYIDESQQCDMSLERFEELVEEIKSWEDEYISLWERTIVPYRRGEFLLDPNYKEICSIIKKHNFRLYFVTNASMLNQEATDFLLDIGIDHIKISRHGVSKEAITNNNLAEHADKAEKNILYFLNEKRRRNSKCYAGLTFTINENNVNEQKLFFDTWKDYVDYIDMSPLNYNCDVSKSKKFKEDYLFFKPNTFLRVPCRGLIYNVWVNSDYSILPCIGGIRENIGYCKDKSILSVIQNSEFFSDLVESHCNGSFAIRESCKDCQQYYADFVIKEENDELLTLISPVMQNRTFKK